MTGQNLKFKFWSLVHTGEGFKIKSISKFLIGN